MKHKVGDKVKVREDLIVDETYDDIYFVEKMEMYKGKEVTINEVYAYNYKIEEDNGRWSWTDNMFEDEPMKIRGFEIVSDDKRKHPQVDIQLPTRGSKHSIAYDLYSPIDVIIQPMEKQLIWTDIKSYFQSSEALLINVRSSMGSHPIIMANIQGWVEMDYYNNPKNDGNLGINLLNLGKEPYVIKKGDRIAQAMFIPFLVSDNCNSEEERLGGFGSTGK